MYCTATHSSSRRDSPILALFNVGIHLQFSLLCLSEPFMRQVCGTQMVGISNTHLILYRGHKFCLYQKIIGNRFHMSSKKTAFLVCLILFIIEQIASTCFIHQPQLSQVCNYIEYKTIEYIIPLLVSNSAKYLLYALQSSLILIEIILVCSLLLSDFCTYVCLK